MESEKGKDTQGGEELPPAETSQPYMAGGEAETGAIPRDKQPAGSGEGDAAPACTRPVQPGAPPAAPSSGGSANWLGRHRLLAGIAIGILAILLLGGMFAIGYAVGRPGDGSPKGAPGQAGPWREMRASPPGGPLNELREGQPDRLEILVTCREELAEFLSGALGMSTDALKEELAGGKTVADLAEEKGLSTEDLIKSVAAKIEEIADRLAAEGEITTTQAERIKARSTSLASMLVHDGLRRMSPPFRRPGSE